MTTPLSDPPIANPLTHVRFSVLAVLCSLAFLTYLDRLCIARAGKAIATELRFDELPASERAQLTDEEAQRRSEAQRLRWLNWVFMAFTIGYMLFEIPGGWLGDRNGVRRTVVQIVLAWSVFTALTGSADRLASWFVTTPGPFDWMIALVVVRFLFGSAAAGAFPNIGRAMGQWFPAAERGTATGVIWMAARLGGALTPLLFGRFIEAFGWRMGFWALGLVGLSWMLFFWWFFRDRPEEMRGISPAEVEHIHAGGGGTGVSHGSLPWLALFGSVNIWAFYGAVIAINFCWFFYTTFLPEYLDQRFHIAPKDSEIMCGLPFAAGMFGCLIGGIMSDRLVRRLGLRWGRSLVALVAMSGAAMAFLSIPLANDPWVVVGLLTLAHFMQDLAVPVVWSLPAEIGGRHAGSVGGAQNAMGGIGGLLGPTAVAFMRGAGIDWTLIFVLFAGVYLLGALCWLRVNAEERLRTHDAI